MLHAICFLFGFEPWDLFSSYHDLWAIGRPHFRVMLRIWGKGFILLALICSKLLRFQKTSVRFEASLCGKVYRYIVDDIFFSIYRFMCVKTSVRTQLNNYVFLERFPIGSRNRHGRMKKMNATNIQHLFYWKYLLDTKNVITCWLLLQRVSINLIWF